MDAMPRHLLRHRAALATSVALATTLTLAACGSGGTSGGGGSGGPDGADGAVDVLASFYPLQFVAERVGGDRVTVANLTPPAAEPHDLELSPAQARSIGTADLVVYQSGFQAAVDEAVDARDPAHLVDATEAAGLEEHPGGSTTDAAEGTATEDEHAAHDDHADDGHDHTSEGGLDPHFWLDPARLVPVAEQVAAELSAVDPDGADEYAANLETLTADLTALDAEYEAGLASCASPYLVTSHEAFGYLAERYGLEQVGITGIDPEAEPSPARLREVADIIRDHGVTTIFFETLTSPKVTQTLARDVGVQAAVLDPLEGLSKDGTDYLGVMRTNLEALRTGLTCA